MEKIKHYKIIEKVGSGGLGIVYKAFDTILEREVAIKVLHPQISDNKQNAERLMREARASAKLVDPHVVTIYEVGSDIQGRYIAMELVNGVPLTDIIYREGPLDPQRAIQIIQQILKALNRAHKLGIFHRDIKPDNVLIGADDHAKVLDFGIAKMLAKSGITSSGEVIGTVEFMAPEQMLGDGVDQRIDIYAAGIVLYQLLTKQLPFTGETPVELLFKKLNEEAVAPSYYNSKVDDELDRIVLKAIHGDKEQRFANPEEFLKALNGFVTKKLAINNVSSWDSEEIIEQADEPPHRRDKYLRKVFVGREKELKQLVRSFQEVCRRMGQSVIVSGEAGVGKSRLASQLRSYVEYQNAWVLYGTCLYQEGMDAYLPFVDAIRDFFSAENTRISEKDRLELKDLIREKVPELSQFTERFTTVIFQNNTGTDGEKSETSINMMESISTLISLMSEVRPIVLIIDDIQWADTSSLKLFHYMARQILRHRVMLYGISRTDRYDLQEDGKPKMIVDIISRMRREELIKEINLSRLTREKSDALVDKALGNTAFSEEFYEGVFVETKGNPFFVLETIKLYKENGLIENKDGIWIDHKIDFKVKIPNRVEDIFIRRLSTLSEEERETLQVASVMGYKYDPSVLAAVLEIPKIQLLKTLTKMANELQIISSTDKYFQFEHPMLGDLLYNEIPVALRKEYHLMIVEEMEKRHGNNFGAFVGEAAQHYRRGDNHEKAIALLYKAGKRAFDMGAYREAGVFLEDLLDSLANCEKDVETEFSDSELYMKLGVCYEEMGRLNDSVETYKKLSALHREKDDHKNHAESLMRMGRIYDKLGDWESALQAYDRCLEIAQEHQISNLYSRVYNKLGVFYFHKGDYDKALEYLRKTINSANNEFGELDKAHAYSNIGVIANILRGSHSVALENFNRAIEIYQTHNRKSDLAAVYVNIGLIYSNSGNWIESIKAFENCLKLTDEGESKHLRALTFLNMGKAYARYKKLDKAKSFTEKALKTFKRMSDLISIAEAYQVYGIIYKEENDFTQAQKYLLDAMRIFKSKDFKEGLAEAYNIYADLCRDNGYYEEAGENYKSALELFGEMNVDTKVKELEKTIEELEKQHVIA